MVTAKQCRHMQGAEAEAQRAIAEAEQAREWAAEAAATPDDHATPTSRQYKTRKVARMAGGYDPATAYTPADRPLTRRRRTTRAVPQPGGRPQSC